MRFSVSHITTYSYEGPVYLEPHVIRLRPRDDGAQRLLRQQLRLEPEPAGTAFCLDQDGNTVLQAWFQALTTSLRVYSQLEVETLRENPFDFLLADPALASLPAAYSSPLDAILVPYTRAEGSSQPLQEFARSVADEARLDTLAFLMTLNRRIFHSFRHIHRLEGAALPAEVTLRSEEGSCRDLAVLFCAACRAMGLAARFVSGYEREASTEEPAYMHAWAEVYLPGGGWRGYDPGRGLAVGMSHIAIAAGLTPDLAAPIVGSYRGNGRSHMDATISIRLE